MAETKAQLEERAAALEAENARLNGLVSGETGSTPETTTGPHVLVGLHSVLAELAVEKNGLLPGNMGGKPYISAADLSREVKALFVQHKLVLVPNESVVRYEIVDAGNRKNTYMVIQGEYQIISKVDGSNVRISGVGDGIAMGSAVTANIASTNALKNALLRTFLVTETSVEDAAKNGVSENQAAPGDRAMQAAAQAQKTRSAVPQPVTTTAEPADRERIRTEFIEAADSPYNREQVNAIMDAVKQQEEFRGGDKLYAEVLRRLLNGELA